MPDEMSARSRLTGIEIDPITAAIARRLYPDADIRTQGFEDAMLVERSFDLAISNVPFGDYKLHDPSVQRAQLSHSRLFFREGDREGPARRIAGFHHVERNAGQGELHACAIISATKRISSARSGCRTPRSRRTRTRKSQPTSFSFAGCADGEKPGGPAWLNLAEHTNPRRRDISDQRILRRESAHDARRRWRTPARCIAATKPALVPDGRDLATA